MKAVVAHALNELSVVDVDLDPPKAGEVLVRMRATGVCHSDLSIVNGTIPSPFPTVLGHEGAGVVEAVGEGVTHVAPGDHVMHSFVPQCGECYHCVNDEPYLCTVAKPEGWLLDGTSRVKLGGEAIAVMTFLGNMAEYAVVPAICTAKIEKDVDFKAAALVGCGVSTGVGAALRTAKVRPGSTVAVFGCGGVGLAVVQGARIAGARQVIAVDRSEEKMVLAREFGATDSVTPGANPAREIMAMTGGVGVDYAFEAIGLTETIEQCIRAARRGGTAVLVGIGRMQERFSVNNLVLPVTAKTIKGCMYGSINFKTDFALYLDLYRRGQLDLDRMVTRTYRIDEAPRAFEDLERGINARGVIVYD